MKNEKTLTDATSRWVEGFNVFPAEMIQRLFNINPDEWYELTPPARNDRVAISYIPETDINGNEYDGDADYGNIIRYNKEKDVYEVELDDGCETIVELSKNEDDFEILREDFFPMWGELWQFGDSADDDWLDSAENRQKMADCGFRIYEHEEWGYFFGIDGCGYSFFGEHFVPLYKARGLQWHETDDTAPEQECNPPEGASMRKFDVEVHVVSRYESSIDIPADMSTADAVKYAEINLAKIPMGEDEYKDTVTKVIKPGCHFAY